MRIERRLVKVLMDLAPEDYKDYISPRHLRITHIICGPYGR